MNALSEKGRQLFKQVRSMLAGEATPTPEDIRKTITLFQVMEPLQVSPEEQEAGPPPGPRSP